MALVTHFDLELHQMDVKDTFLNEEIDETIYMEQLKFSNWRSIVHGLRIKEISLWTEAISSSMVSKIS